MSVDSLVKRPSSKTLLMAKSHSELVILSLKMQQDATIEPVQRKAGVTCALYLPPPCHSEHLKGLLVLNPPSTGMMLSVLLCMISVFHPHHPHRFLLSRSWICAAKKNLLSPLLFNPNSHPCFLLTTSCSFPSATQFRLQRCRWPFLYSSTLSSMLSPARSYFVCNGNTAASLVVSESL